jgi:hypothetical protein
VSLELSPGLHNLQGETGGGHSLEPSTEFSILADNRIAVCRRPAAAPPSRPIEVGDQRELAASAASA